MLAFLSKQFQHFVLTSAICEKGQVIGQPGPKYSPSLVGVLAAVDRRRLWTAVHARQRRVSETLWGWWILQQILSTISRCLVGGDLCAL